MDAIIIVLATGALLSMISFSILIVNYRRARVRCSRVEPVYPESD